MDSYLFAKRKSYIEPGEIFFWTATIHNWQRLLLKDEYKNVIINSLPHVQAAEGKRPDRNAEMKSGVKICLRHMENKLKPLLALKYKAIDDAKKELGISLIRSTFIGFQGYLCE
jgi:hypothetical protein